MQTRYRDKADLQVLSRLLSCEASFIASRDFSIYRSDSTDIPKRRIQKADLFLSAENSPFAEQVNILYQKYSEVKSEYISDHKKNMFY